MSRWTWPLLLFAGCAAPPPPDKPLTPEETYERIRQVFIAATTAGFKTRFDSQTPTTLPSTLAFASGNRIRVTWGNEAFSSNGTQATYTTFRQGTQPEVWAVPPDLSLALKRDLLLGSLARGSNGHVFTGTDAMSLRYIPYADYRGTRQFAFGADGMLSFRVYRTGTPGDQGYPVSLRYDPKTFALLGIESRLPEDRSRIAFTLTLEAAPELPRTDDLFMIPEDPKIRINATKADLALIREALERYLIDNHAYPTTVQSLDALVREPQNPKPVNWKGPYVKGKAPIVDAWGRPYSYRSPRPQINPEGYDLWSWGWDGISGNGDDLKR